MARIRAEGGGRRVGAVRKRERRRWTVAEKIRIVREMARTGAGMREIGRRHGAHVSMLKRWHAQYRAGEFDARQAMTERARLVPVCVTSDETGPSRRAQQAAAPGGASATGGGAIEVQLTGGQRLCIRGTVDAGMLRAVLAELSRS